MTKYLKVDLQENYGMVNEIDDYEGPYMANDNFYEETKLTDRDLIDLFEFD